ncbi:efflux RND transporter periplasmic adaptor subunit [Sulfuricurvum sp.]|uniref:efflux RND transporter periplasmic adaptor subunit n=1 Tax=Sulfuricurvum sp. TaxID=2025608 RepID=UPI002621405A|nr:efflux RND transporter periplasmic adaptor subunit [Sulfuricurvum sp.]MDD2266976.1 efflux RND transporter periplasmic adaptor subunit [Sulfuricurvum sp.]MDD2784081.1 efflux RND transporter periplasmic adaptor subunit [Sulfuricurvum sp.]HZF70758.1 efflux RND transporter periplasmic adaptor subunit [Sulfuricurvum sp.]
MKFWITSLALASTLSAAGLSLSGSVISDNQKMITSRNMGFVTSVNVSEGSRVTKGQLLYTIDSREIDSAKTQVELGIAQAELSLQMYQNQYANLELNLERNKRLLAQDMVSKYEVENLELSKKNLQNMIEIGQRQVNQARARLKEVNNQYNYLNVTAPNNGVVVAKNIKVGEMAMPGMPAIVLSDLNALKIEVEVAENNLQMVPIGQRVKVTIPSVGFVGIGKVSAIIPSSNPMTHSFKIKVSFNAKQTVYPGMYATVDIQ